MISINNKEYGERVHNCYTVRAKSGCVTAFNAMTPDFWRVAAENAAWAQTLALTDENGSVLIAPAQLRYADCNPARGNRLRAVYYGSVRCLQGHRYVRAGLCCDETGTQAVSTAEIDFTSAGEETEITAVVCLETTENDAVHFCGGDNPLVRRLLGCGTDASMLIGWGPCDYPARVLCRTTDGIEGLAPACLTAESTGLSFASNAPAYGAELLLCDGYGVPIMRALRPYSYEVRTVYETVTERSAVLLSENRPEAVFSARIGNDAMLRVDTCRVCDSVFSVTAENVVHLGASGQMKSDPGEEYLCVITANEVSVYRVDSLDLSLVFRVPRTTEEAEICRGGAVALWSADTLTVYEPDENGVYTSFSAALPRGNDGTVLREGTRYHVAYRKAGMFYRYELTRAGGLKLKEQAKMTAALAFVGRCGDALVRAEKTLKVKTLDADVSAEFSCVGLGTHLTARSYAGKGNCFAAADEGGVYRIYDFVHDTVTDADGVVTANGRLLYGEGGVYVYDFYNGIRKIDGNCDMQNVSGACLAGDGLFTVRNNDLYVYYCSGAALAVRMPAGSEGKQFFANVRERVLAGAGRGVRFTVGDPQ